MCEELKLWNEGLKPCHCGGEVDPWEEYDGNGWCVECRKCGTIVKKSPTDTASVEDWWNGRAE